MKKNVWSLVLCLILALGAVSVVCAGAQNEDAAASGTGELKTVEFMWQNVGDENEGMWREYFIQPYMDKNPSVDLVFTTSPDIRAAVKVQLAAGTGPDIFMMDAFDIIEYAKADRIISLDSYSKEYGWEDIMYDWAYASALYDGELYAVPYAAEVTLLWYNQTIMDENGWSVPETRAEFEEVAESAVAAGLIPIAYGFSGLPLLNQWLYDHYINAYAGADRLVAVLKGDAQWTDQDIVDAFKLLKSDWDRGWWNERQSGAISIDEARNLFGTGKALFNPEGTWLASARIIFDDAYEFNATPWPSMRTGIAPSSSVAAGEVITVNKTAQYPEVAADILNFLYTELDTIGKGIGYGAMEVLCRDVDPKYYPEDTDHYVRLGLELIGEIMRENENLGYAPWGFYPNKTNQYLMDNLDKVFYDRLTVEEYLAEAQEIFAADVAEGYVFAGE